MIFNNEKEVEHFYWEQLEKIGKIYNGKQGTIDSTDQTDGILTLEDQEGNKIRTLCEFKYDLNLTEKNDAARVIIQAIYYLHKFVTSDIHLIPSSILIGDKNEYFVLSVSHLEKFFINYKNDDDPNWKIAPSSAYKDNMKMFMEIYKTDFPIIIKELKDKLDTEYIYHTIKNIAENNSLKFKLDEKTIKKAFFLFTNQVLRDASSIKDHTKIAMFKDLIMNEENTILKDNRIRFDKAEYPINRNAFLGFVNQFQTQYKASEKEKIIANIDSLLSNEVRRFQGAFFTPKIIVDYAHEVMTKNLGENWKDEYVVWDPCCGTKNLTKDYCFKELYLSTLEQEELDLSEDLNTDAAGTFQFDFLNDEFKAARDGGKIPNGLYDAINDENRKVLILMNPPYANTGTGHGNCNTSEKTGRNINTTNIQLKNEMKKLKFGMSSKDLVVKFIYLASQYADKMFIFSNTAWILGSSAYYFRKYMQDNFKCSDNFLFDSGYFDGCRGGWPIIFSCWIEKNKEDLSNKIYGKYIKVINTKIVDDKIILLNNTCFPYSDYINDLNEKDKNNVISAPTSLSMPCTEQELRTDFKIPKKNYLGSSPLAAVVAKYSGDRGIYTMPYSNKGTARINIDNKNLFDACIFNSVRGLIKPTIYNYNDTFLIPRYISYERETKEIKKENPNYYINQEMLESMKKEYDDFKYDSLVYSLFGNQSYQSSLRKKNGASCDVFNPWYILSLEETKQLADDCDFTEVYQDCKGKSDTYIYSELQRLISENKFSKEALDVLEAGRKLFRDTMELRKDLHIQYPQYHLNTWDCGYWQLRTALEKAGMKGLLSDLKEKYKILEEKMRPMVYELGFLRNNPNDKVDVKIEENPQESHHLPDRIQEVIDELRKA